MGSEKPTAAHLRELRRDIEADSGSAWDLPGIRALLLDAYEATQRPIEPDPDAPLDVADLPAFWDARRARLGKNASVCAAELRRALEHASGEVFQLRAEVERIAARCVVLQENLDMCCETPPSGCDCSGCSWARQQSEAPNDE